jgi:hypothetical protein
MVDYTWLINPDPQESKRKWWIQKCEGSEGGEVSKERIGRL